MLWIFLFPPLFFQEVASVKFGKLLSQLSRLLLITEDTDGVSLLSGWFMQKSHKIAEWVTSKYFELFDKWWNEGLNFTVVGWLKRLDLLSLQRCDIFVSLLLFPFLSFAVIWRRCAAILGILMSHISPFKFFCIDFILRPRVEGLREKERNSWKTVWERKKEKNEKMLGLSRCSDSWFSSAVHTLFSLLRTISVFHLKDPPLAAVLCVWRRFMDSEGSSVDASHPACSVWFGLVWDFFFLSRATGSTPLAALLPAVKCDQQGPLEPVRSGCRWRARFLASGVWWQCEGRSTAVAAAGGLSSHRD